VKARRRSKSKQIRLDFWKFFSYFGQVPPNVRSSTEEILTSLSKLINTLGILWLGHNPDFVLRWL